MRNKSQFNRKTGTKQQEPDWFGYQTRFLALPFVRHTSPQMDKVQPKAL
ncbi:MAG: hypothetical protein ACTS2F_31175 [Thainema sp.]